MCDVGGPGCGKADQCKFLVDKYKGWVHLSMGNLLRAERKKHGAPNKGWSQIGSIMDSGDLVPEVSRLALVSLSLYDIDLELHLHCDFSFVSFQTNFAN